MRKIISLVLAVAMLCSLIAIPVSAETERESLLEREIQYIDIISTARAGTATPAFRDSFKKDASLYHLTEPSVFTQNRTDTQYHEILNTMWLGWSYKGAPFTGTNQTLNFFDITVGGYAVIGTDTSMGTRAKTIDTEGVISYESGEAEEYDVNYYKFGNYKIGPVSVEDDDPETDVFYSPNTVFLGGNSEGGSVNSQTFEELNVKGKYLNLLLSTHEFEGDASIIPVKVDYTTGDAETFYVFTTKFTSADRLSTLVKVLPKKAEGTYTQEELVNNASNFVYLTAEKREELGIEIQDIDEITFDGLAENVSFIFPEKTAIRYCNRNKNGADAKDVYVEDITLPLDTEREVSKVTITNWVSANEIDALVAPYNGNTGNTDYRKVTIDGYEGDNEFYVYFGRTCQKRSVLLGMSVLSETFAERIAKVNEKIANLDTASATSEECEALRLEIAELKASNTEITDADFDTTKLDEAEERIAEEESNAEKENALNDNHPEYVELYLFQDVFATYAERKSEVWYEWTAGEGKITTIWPFKGIGRSISPAYPLSRSSNSDDYAMMIDLTGRGTSYPDAIDLKTNSRVSYDEKLGRYIVKADNVTYKLGKIEEGKFNGNYATFGVKYDISSTEIADGLGIKEQALNTAVYPNLGTSSEVTKAIYPINKSGVKELNLLLTSFKAESNSKDWAKRVPATIEYEDGEKVQIGLLVGTVGASHQDTIFAAPTTAQTFADIDADKVIANTVLGKDVTNENVTIPSLDDEVYIPEESFILATNMRHYQGGEFAGYVNSFSIPVKSEKTIKSVTFEKNSADVTQYFSTSFANKELGTDKVAFVPVTVEGASTDYNYYIKVERSCGSSGIFAMTLTYPSLQDKIADLENRMINVATQEDVEEIDAEKTALIEETIVEESDFDATVLANYAIKKQELALQAEEEVRQEKLKEKNFTYLDFEKDRDVFASYKDISDLARFNKSSSGTTDTSNFNTVTYDHNGVTIFDWIPHQRADGTKITGKEVYYYKGFANEESSTLPESERGSAKPAGYTYIADDLIEEDGTALPGQRVNAVSSSATHSSKDYYDGTLYRIDANRTVKNPTFVQKMDEDGYVIIKNGDVQTKIGPVSKTEVKPNAMRLNTTHKIDNVNVKGASLDVVITSTAINTAGGYTTKATATDATKNYLATQATPTAALQVVKVNYADGTTESKKVLVTHNLASSASDTAYRSIVFAPKKDAQGNDIVYDNDSFYINSENYDFQLISSKNLSTIGLTSVDEINTETVKFESNDIIYSTVGTIAQGVNNRQDACNASYGNYTSYASIPLKYKEVESIQMVSSMTAATEDTTAIVVENEPTSTANPSIALLPLTIEGASDDYYYFAYVGRVASDSYLMGATITESSAREKLDAADAAMRAITVNSSLEDAKKALELYNIAKAAPLVDEAKDIDPDLVVSFMQTYEIIKLNTPLKGKMNITYYAGEAPKADITIKNGSEAAGKPYKVVLTFYDEKGIMLGKHIVDKTSTGAVEETFSVTPEQYPENAVKVKGFIWKDLATIEPLADVADSQAQTSLKILSIGNSYSQDAHTYLAEIAQNAGFEDVVIGNAYIGGCSLTTHYQNIQGNNANYSYQTKIVNEDGSISKTSIGEQTLLQCIKAEDWDIITIQQQSYSSSDPTTFTNLQAIIDYVNENKTNSLAKVVWHMTWGYEASYAEKHTQFKTNFDGDTVKMYNAIVSTTNEMIDTNEDIAYVIPAGTAVQNVRTTKAFASVSSDGTHMNEVGDYVVGLTWFAKITGKSIDDITFTPNENPEIAEKIDTIKACVKNAINNPYQVTE